MPTLHSMTALLASRRARLFLVLTVMVGLLALASAGFAIEITTITPSWASPTGSSGAPDCLYLNNLTSPVEVRFGDTDLAPPCPPPAQQSGLGFTAGATGSFANGTPFVLGELTHFNLPVFASSLLTSATLNINLGSTLPTAPAISTLVTVDETANNLGACPLGDTPPCADQITIAPSVVSFTEGGGTYQLEILGLIPGTPGTCTFSQTDLQLSLISEENTTTSACLYGRVQQTDGAELEITKSTPATVMVPGEIVEFQIDYSCASTTTSCLDVSLTDFLPPQLEYVSSTGSIHTANPFGTYTPASNTVLFDFIDPLPAGSTGFITVLARVLNNGSLANGQMITNTAVSTNSNGETHTSSTTTPVQTISAWDVQKSGDPVAYISTEPPITDMHYTVQICPNGSNVNLIGAQMVDTLPPGATFVSATGGGVYDSVTHTVTWALGDLLATDPCVSREVVIRFTNPPPPATPLFVAGQTVVNNVTGTGTPVGEPPWTDTASLPRVLQDFIPNPSMTLDKGTTRTDYVIGAQVDYALTPRNTGNTNLYNLVMTDTVPDAMRVTAVEVGGSAYPIVIEYAINGSGSYSTWPGSPFNSNTTLNVSSLGLGVNDWVTSVRWRFNPGASTPPGWTLNPPARIIGTITSPDRLGNPLTVGSQVVNHATIGWEYLPGGGGVCTDPGGVCGSGNDDATIDIVAMPVPVFDKTSGGGVNANQRFIIGQQVGYFDLAVNNNTGIAIDNLTLTDDIPAPFNVTAVNVGSYNNWSGTVGLRYQASNNPGVWVNWPGTPFAEGATANAPALGAGVYISRIEFSYGTVPAGFRGAPRIFGTTLETDRNGNPVADGSPMHNEARMDWTYQNVPSTRTDTTDDPIRRPTVTPLATKAVTNSGPFVPTSAVNFRLGIGADPNSPSNVMNNPIASDLLPLNFNYVSYTYDDNGTGLPAPAFTQIANFNGTGRTLLRWNFTGTLQRGQTVFINLNTTLAAGTLAGAHTNEVRVSITDMPVNDGTPDTGDWDGVGGEDNTVKAGSVVITVAPLVGLDSHKAVRGELDSGYSVFPSYGQTVPNGDVDYRLTVVNRGNVPINNVRVIDILPFVGDTGVRDLRPRNSDWEPVLTSPVTPQAGVTIYYSTAGNPCRPEVVSTGPAGCTAPNWSLVPPSPISSVQSLRFDFAGTLQPGQSFTFQWQMRAPASAPVGSIAWNSFAFSSTNADTGVPLFPAEPNKVGIVFNAGPSALIDIEKYTNTEDADLPTGPMVPLNGTVTWDYVVTNIGQTRLGSVTVTDDIEGAITCPKTTLEIGETMTCTLVATTPLTEGQYANNATVVGTPIDGNGDPIPDLPPVTDEDPSHYYGYDPLLARLGDYTWIDLNADGIQDAGEPPLGGVTVHLLDSAGNTVDDPSQPGIQPYITMTDANGLYQFANLAAGTYRVRFDIPTAYTLTLQNAGSDDALDSDPDPVTGITAPVTLAAGEVNLTLDAGFIARAALGDRIWIDSNGNGIQDASETSVALVGGLPVELMDATGTTVLATTYTDLAGNYLFTDLAPGSYRVRFPVPPTGYLWTTPNAGSDPALDSDVIPATRLTAVTTLDAGEVDPTWDGGLVPAASLGDYVWYDNNFNGIQNSGEPGVPGVTVRLLDSSGNQATRDDGSLIPDVTTDANGYYAFTGLRPGVAYEVQFTRPANTIFTTQNAGSNDALDSDAIESGPNIGRTAQTTLTPGQNDTRWDAGLIRLASLGDFVWRDNNNNGQQDTGEPGVAGAIVRLLDSSGNPVTQDALGNPISAITTDATGFYSFTNLDPRIQYIVEFQRPADYVFSPANTGNDVTDSDAVPSGSLPLGIGRTGVISLAAGQNNMTIDAGLVPDSSLGDFVWYDNNNNGIQDAGEPGVPNVTVRLLTTSGAQATDERGNLIPDQTTDANGAYLFEHLRPGSYRIQFLPTSLPIAYTFARQNVGSNDAVNSDPDRFNGRTGTITLPPNTDDMRWDAGIVTEAALGNFVWEDYNANGIQDAGEPGVAGVTVRLLNSSNGAIDNPNDNIVGNAYTVTTDASGYYVFVGLPPNETYRVRFDRPTGFIWTRGNQGSDDTVDSDGVVVTVTSANITTGNITTLTPGSTDDNWDQGVLRPSGLGNLVWSDNNDDGLQTAGEPGIAGVTVRLLDSAGNPVDNPNISGNQDYVATTNASGIYAFTNLYPGQYIVEFDLPAGYLRSAYNVGGNPAVDSDAQIADGRTPVITLPYNTTDNTWDAGLVPLATIGDFVWSDDDNDGIQDTGEPGIAGVTVRLLNSDGTPVTLDALGNTIPAVTTTTNSSGLYSFTNLNPRLDYIVEFVRPAGYKASPQNQGGNDAVDSDADVTTGRTATIALDPGQDDDTWDAGFTPLARIGDFVWVDSNGNGQQDAGETGINGVTVTLLDGSGNPVTADGLGNAIGPIQTINHPVTGAPGYYQFSDLNAGSYQVQFTLPNGYIFTRQNVGNDLYDSDADRVTGRTGTYTLGWGGSNQTADAGIVQPASLGDYIWYDGNDNGLQDDGPNVTVGAGANGGMNGIYVELLDGSGNPVDIDLVTPGVQNRVTTANDGGGNPGYYLFENLIPGDYRVFFNLAGSPALPLGGTNNANYVFARQNQGGNDAVDSDPDRMTGVTANIGLSAGENDLTNDAGILLRGASLGNRVWIDINNNGIQDAGEVGLDGVTVTLLNGSGGPDIDPIAPGVQTMSTTTSTDGTYGAGWYEFTGLVPGTYIVEVTLPAHYQFSPQNQGSDDTLDSDVNQTTGRTAVITISENQHDPTWDAGLVPLASIGDRAWIDSNDNGIQDSGEAGLAGVTVNLYDGSGALVATTTTDSNGNYLFSDLPPGDYSLGFVRPNGYLFSPQNQGSDDAFDSDANPATGRTITTTLSPGENDLTWDAGFVPLAALGDFVWRDNDGDGIQDAGEPGLAGVTVTLLNAATGNPVTTDGNGNSISPVTTTGSGAYAFTNLDPRLDYIVQFSLPAGYIRSPQNQGGNDAVDSDADVTTGRTATIALDPGQTDNTWDAGYSPLSSLGDFVWNDVDGDGIQDAGESGIAGAVVTLLDGSGNPVTTDALGNTISPITTTGTGAYSFTNLPAGTYQIRVVPPTGYVLTLQNQGADDTADSDVDRFTGVTANVALGWGEHNPTIDAGVFRPASLGDFVWEDLNYNGQQDSGEPAVAGVTVRLLDSIGNPVDDPNTAGTQNYVTTTDASGLYSFTGLFPGSYIVEFVAPTGSEFTQPNVGPDATDSDANVTTGRTGVYTLAAGDSNLTVDAGIFYRASLGDRVWVDLNNNGLQDTGEAGYPGATVTLYTGAGVQVGTQTTDASGNYLFDNLTPGDYYVVVTLPSGYQFSPQQVGSDPAVDSDPNVTTGRMPTTTLISGENDLTWDAGLVPLASIGDRVWNDVDGNGVQDSGETGISGVTVNLYRPGDTVPYRTTTTDGNGNYLFDDLPPGDYFLEFVPPAGMIFTHPNVGSDTTDSDADRFTGRTVTTTLSPGENDLSWDAGLLQPAALGNYVWEDVNDNGLQDEPASAGQNGVTVRLLDSSGNPVDNPNTATMGDAYVVTTANDGSGNPGYYAFTGLFPGDYIVEFVTPSSSWTFARQNQGSDDAIDSDADRTTGRTAAVNLVAGETDNTLDAGLLQLASLGDRVWVDINNNGLQDSGESGYPGAIVTLYDGSGTQVATTTTDASGNYLFDDLIPGDYYVVVTLPSGYQFSPQQVGGDPTVDSDPDLTTGQMPTTTLISGENDLTWDAGLVPLASIGDRVWSDYNGDGVQDAGEPGLPGVTVNLYDGSGALVATTTTDASGNYLFDNLPPGDYSLEFVRPAGYTSSPQNQGGDPATDSDADPATGRTIVTTLAPDEHDMTWDAGFIPLGSLGDRVWMDRNRDGVQDPGEEGLIGVRLILTLPDGTTRTTTTNTSGLYLFDQLPPGVYTVTVDPTTLPPGVYQTYDLDGFLDHATTYTLGPNENVRTLDFGYAPYWYPPTPTPELTPTPTATPVRPTVPGVPGTGGGTTTTVGEGPVCRTGCPNFRLYHTDETGDWEIFRLDSADPQTRTTTRVNLSLGEGPGIDDMAPSLSPNSEWIVFTSNRDTVPGQPANWEIYVAPTSGGNPNAIQRVTYNNYATDTDPVWGPNNWVVFETNRNGNWDLYAVDMSTGIEYRLTDSTADDINAFWSPDGSRLVFQSQRDGQWQVYELTLASGAVRRLSDGSAIDVDPVYSPDGMRIAFRSYSAADANSVITLMNGDGTNRLAISSTDGDATNQAWSPDSALIAYQSDLDGDLDIYVYEVGSRATRQITDNTIPDYAPAWRCSNDIVIFTSDIAGDPNIYEENARPITDPSVLVEVDSDQLTFEIFDDIYPQMSPSEENASREGQTPDGVFGAQTEFLRPVIERITPDLSVDGIIRKEWNALNTCPAAN